MEPHVTIEDGAGEPTQGDLFAIESDVAQATPTEPVDVPHALYRFWSEDGVLLYVGITQNPGARWKAHSKDKPWWHEVWIVTKENHPSRDAVERAELAAIRYGRPKYNVKHNNTPGPLASIETMHPNARRAAAEFFRARALIKRTHGPLTPEQLMWVSEMLDMASDLKDGPESVPASLGRGLLELDGSEVWVCPGNSNYVRLCLCGLSPLRGTGAESEWTESDTRQLQGKNVVVVVARLEEEWAKAARIESALQGSARRVRVVRPAVGLDLAAHQMAGLRLTDLVAVDPPMAWADEFDRLVAELGRGYRPRRVRG